MVIKEKTHDEIINKNDNIKSSRLMAMIMPRISLTHLTLPWLGMSSTPLTFPSLRIHRFGILDKQLVILAVLLE